MALLGRRVLRHRPFDDRGRQLDRSREVTVAPHGPATPAAQPYDLKLSLSSARCSGVAVAPEEFIVQLDGVAGTPPSLHYANEAVFTWAPFPEAPTVPALTDLFVEKLTRWNRAGDARECRPSARVRGFGNGVGLKRLGFCDAESPRRTRQGVRGGTTHKSGLWSIRSSS